ncbi:MAG: hypothetical protein Q8R33_11000 [Burkholderiales bacterium]|nr:hypothetical protein [Burkholderiales bacterium]
MNQPTTPADVTDEAQRAALEKSEKKAAEKHPDNFKDEATEEKIVEIGPDLTEAPIKGIDPDPGEPA